jgi:hypothetical protein
MALKRHLSQDQKFGLTEEEIKISEKYLRKFKTAGAVVENESMKLYELFMLGYSFSDIQQQYPQYPIAQIILTAALRGWCKDRDKMMGSLKDRIQAKVVKSIIEQVDFLTTMLSVTNVQHMDVMRKFIMDPVNNPLPSIYVQNIKEYKEVAEVLHKLVAGVSPGPPGKKNAMMDALSTPIKTEKLGTSKQPQTLDIRQLAADTEYDD